MRSAPLSVPRIVIAAPASGHGKTTVATGIIKALTDRGFTVAPFKVGPDYIDPGYHSLAAGRTGRNLDPYMVGTERIAPLFAHGAAGADLAVVEGVMGLYDGATGEGELASTAQVAKLLDAPVLFVVDAAAQGRSIAALLHGFRSFDPAVRIAGVVLNRVGSDNHRNILTQALDEIGLPVLGALRRDAAVSAPSRHLGLVPVAERRAEALASVAALGALVDTGLQLDEVYRLARSAPPLDVTAWDPFEEVGSRRGARPRIAVASGPAFTFSYAENTELLAAAGAEVCPFDPLREEKLPERVCGLVLGGGFPEVYAPELAANEALRENVAEFARLGGAIAAECAGLLYLGKSLDGLPMCGVVDAEAVMTDRLTLGYRHAVAASESVLAAAGTRVSGHEFHRTAVSPSAGSPPAWHWRRNGGAVTEGFAGARIHASYLHLHWAGAPSIARRLVESCGVL
ncbi:cobyrinic acid a,c-diamide synthase [Catenulispora acidiphila DSM 44928]|uniref:Hydrogenobyrinate a,c-diamide synthase n=1 Tax=Catenulispora acidiphila (strain DSM 44928 / JCM 14897 / NBRC 102108 / NRRL B-24433 / ID139908) TaxID=479433 RepID=C7QGL4_CATAD|nr:cobyrinate a,c-diamide synthase [Catenulispora acidiphila]ACU74894.1 cobyrinic acid a,c-diamide synthase [Catenulispora acidiphila DSM 44928]